VFPELFKLGPITVYSYGVLLAVSYLVGLKLAMSRARKRGLDSSRVLDLGIYIIVAALVGAKLLLLVVDVEHYWNNPAEIVSLLRSGGVFYGGLILAVAVAFWYIARHKMPFWTTCDVFAPGIALGHVTGRLGCFAAGCCYGRATDVSWAVTFTDPYVHRQVGTPLDMALHPSQIYESLLTLGIFLIVMWIARHKQFHGQVLLAYVSLYAAGRFVLEYFRGDAARGVVFGGALSTSQFIAVLMLLAAVLLYPYLARKQRIPVPA
jgi:phosphatidylglycerol:prolipoprotein diacylglycerol transferase